MNNAQQLAERLRAIRNYADEILGALEQEAEPTTPAALSLRKSLQSCAEETRRTAANPVKVGVVGEFSSGKTLLLGSLIGYADGLPVSEVPTTGNVTALRFIPQEPGRPTTLETFTAEFLDRAGVTECLQYILAEARNRLRVAQLPPEKFQALDGLEESLDWGGVEDWCLDVWKNTSDPAVRYLLRELTTFARACSSCWGALSGRTYQVSPAVAREAMEMAPPPQHISSMKFDQLPPRPPSLENPPESLTGELLRAAFPVIRRLEANVRLSPEVWDFSGLRGATEFVLLDFPGLGAANSGIRDAFLCNRELKAVQTILILLNGKRPGSGEALKLFRMMHEHRPEVQDLENFILVGVGRFDELPLAGEGGLEKLARLAGASAASASPLASPSPFDDVFDVVAPANPAPAGPGLTDEQVFQELPVLGTVVADATALTKDRDRIVLLSSALSLDRLAQRSRHPVGSEQFLRRLAETRPASEELRSRWQRLAERLGDSELSRWLRAVADDGGRQRLQELLLRHVADHGLRHLCQQAQAEYEKLKNLQRSYLPAAVGASGAGAGDRTTALRDAIVRLEGGYGNLAENLDATLDLSPDGSARVNDVVQEEWIGEVFCWPKLRRLLELVREGKVILPVAAAADTDVDTILGGPFKAAEPVVVRSEELYQDFAASVARLEQAARKAVRAAIPQLLQTVTASLARERADVSTLIDFETARIRLTAQYGSEGERMLRPLLVALQPEPLAEVIAKRVGLDSPQAALDPAAYFPYPRADHNGQGGRTFPWAPGLARSPQGHHLVYVLRMRNELLAGGGLALEKYVARLAQTVVGVTKTLIRDAILPRLAACREDGTILGCLTGESHADRASSPNGDSPVTRVPAPF